MRANQRTHLSSLGVIRTSGAAPRAPLQAYDVAWKKGQEAALSQDDGRSLLSRPETLSLEPDAAARPSSRPRFRRLRSAAPSVAWEPCFEPRAVVLGRRHRDVSSVRGDYLLRDVQPQSEMERWFPFVVPGSARVRGSNMPPIFDRAARYVATAHQPSRYESADRRLHRLAAHAQRRRRGAHRGLRLVEVRVSLRPRGMP